MIESEKQKVKVKNYKLKEKVESERKMYENLQFNFLDWR